MFRDYITLVIHLSMHTNVTVPWIGDCIQPETLLVTTSCCLQKQPNQPHPIIKSYNAVYVGHHE